jgi:FkbM family methyltransferase
MSAKRFPLTDAAGAAYRRLVAAGAALVSHVPALEPPFVAITRTAWGVPGFGRVAQSVAYRLADRLRHNGSSIRRVMIAKVPLRVDVSDWLMIGVYFGGVEYEPATTRYITEHLGPGQVFLDIGANSGYFTLLAAERVGASGHVYAFEPNPPVFDALARHVALNEYGDRVRLFDFAASYVSSDNLPFFVSQSPTNTGLSSLVIDLGASRQHLSASATIVVRTRTIDAWLSESAVERVTLVKIDVENAEQQVITGMAAALKSGLIERLIVETCPGSTAHQTLLGYGYVAEILEHVGPLANIAYSR